MSLYTAVVFMGNQTFAQKSKCSNPVACNFSYTATGIAGNQRDPNRNKKRNKVWELNGGKQSILLDKKFTGDLNLENCIWYDLESNSN